SAYRTSPFYEYYEDDLMPLFQTPFTTIMDLNFKCFDVLLNCLQLEVPFTTSEDFEKDPGSADDYRCLVDPKHSDTLLFDPYTQVFESKHGFINNLSILDLLFNEGPNAVTYLKSQSLNT
ncbi:MAG: WbqC family protein, partial [Bacteroidota bacterium]